MDRQFGTSDDDQAWAAAIDTTGVYVTGAVKGPLPGQSGIASNSDAFVRKYDLNGNVLWTRQFVTGIFNVPNRTRVILINNSDEADSGVLQFIDNQGQPTQVSISGVMTSSVDYDLGPWNTTEVVTDGTEPTIKSGIIALQSNRGPQSRVEGTEAFEVLGNFVSVPSSPPPSVRAIVCQRLRRGEYRRGSVQPRPTESDNRECGLVRQRRPASG